MTPYTLKQAYDLIWSGTKAKLIFTPNEKEDMKKVITNFGEGASHNVSYKPDRPTHTAPVINFSYVNDEGEVMHQLVNGNELSETNFIKHWGQPKGKINMQAKDLNPDPRKRF